MIGQIILQIVLIALNAVFACAEIAVLSMNESKIEKLSAEGNKKAKRLKKLTSQPARFLATIQVAITLSGFLGSAFAADNFSEVLVTGLMNLGVPVPKETLDTISVVVITILLSFITLVFGELVPKRIAMKKTESLALGLSGTVSFISTAFSPLVWLLTASTNLVLRIFRINPDADDSDVSEENIRMMADAGSQKGIIDKSENIIIQNVFEFDDISVEEIMTHRTEMVYLKNEDSIEKWCEIIKKNNHIYYPVCHNSTDKIVGVLDSRKFFRLEDKSSENVLKNAIDEPLYISSHIKANELFRIMKKNKKYFAIAIDEFGGTDGIISVNDLIEELVGEIDDINSEIKKKNDDTYEIICSAELLKVAKLLDLELESDAITFNGWIIEQVGFVPKKGYEFEYEDYEIKILDSDEKLVKKVEIKKD